MKRSTISVWISGARLDAMVAAPKNKVVRISTSRRPTLSAIGPNTKAPTIRPNSPAPNKGASIGGVRLHAARSAGAMKPMAAVSNPSMATTRKHSAITSFWVRDRVCVFRTS